MVIGRKRFTSFGQGSFGIRFAKQCDQSSSSEITFLIRFLKQKAKKRLSNSALETLSIIAYKQPVTKSEIEIIRGVASDYAVQKLLEKELITIKGKAEKIGRPLLYGTSDYFYEYFGINSEKDLPTLKDLKKNDDNEIGENEES